MKTCPYCAEEIQDAAIVCRYCGRDLPAQLTKLEPKKRGRGIGAGVIIFLILLTIAKAARIFNTVAPPQTTLAISQPTQAPAMPTKTAVRPRPTVKLTESSCTWWYELRENMVGTSLCVQGEISSITGNTESNPITRIYFRSGLPDGYSWTDGTPTTFYFVDETYYYRDLSEGDCVIATGAISMNENGILFMRIKGEIEKCG